MRLLPLLLLPCLLLAQVTFQRTYGGADWDLGYSVDQTSDSGYIIAGVTESFGAGQSDVYLIRTDRRGNLIWTRAFGGTDFDRGFSVRQTADRGCVVAGRTESFGAGRYDAWLIKTDSNGDTMWTRTFGGEGYDEARSVCLTRDSGYAVAGWFQQGVGPDDIWLIRTDADGETLWTRAYGGAEWDEGHSVSQTSDNGFIVAGFTESFGSGSYDFYLIKTDASGDTMWTRAFGGADWDEASSVTQCADGGYAVTGWTRSHGAGEYDVWLVRTDTNGDTMWTRTFGGPEDDYGHSVLQTQDRGYVVAGRTSSFGAGSDDLWLIRTDPSGDTVWTRTFGGTGREEGRSAKLTADGGYVIAGWTIPPDTSGDVWLVKTDSAGYLAVAETPEPERTEPLPEPTIVGRVLWLGPDLGHDPKSPSGFRSCPALLLDASGRVVTDLRPGPNDIRHVTPGVYFITPHPNPRASCPASPSPQGAREHRSAVRKIVIQR